MNENEYERLSTYYGAQFAGDTSTERLNTAMGQGIKVGDLVRYTRGDVLKARGIGRVIRTDVFEYEDGLKVPRATVEYPQRPEIFTWSTALVNLEVVPQTDELEAMDEATTPLQTEYLARHEGMKDMTFAQFVEWYVDEHERLLRLDYAVSMGDIHDELAALKAEVQRLRDALQPFALAANDPDVRNADDGEPLEIERHVGYASVQTISIIIDWDATTQEELKVSHLRAAADALKAAKP